MIPYHSLYLPLGSSVGLSDPDLSELVPGLQRVNPAIFRKRFELLKLSYYGKDAPPPTPPPMSRADEQRAFMRYYKRRNAKDRELLLRHYLCWSFGVASKFKGPRLNFDEAISVANEGLVEALNGFNPTLGFRFTTFAAWYLRRKLITAIVGTYPVHVSDHVRKKWRALVDDPEKLALSSVGDEPRTLEEFFNRLGEGSDVDVTQMHERPEDAPFAPSAGANPAHSAIEKDLSSEVRAALALLEPLEREVMLARHYREPAESYLSLGKRLRISKSRARDSYDMALKKLRTHFVREN